MHLHMYTSLSDLVAVTTHMYEECTWYLEHTVLELLANVIVSFAAAVSDTLPDLSKVTWEIKLI